MSTMPTTGAGGRPNLSLGKKLLFLLIVLAFFLALCEGALHCIHRWKHGTWLWCVEDNFKVGYVDRIADRREYSLRRGFRDNEKGITVDEQGFRVTHPAAGADQPLLVCIGDSVPFGVGVRDDQTGPSHLARKLKQHGSPLGVLNAGVPSYNFRQAMDRFRFDVLPGRKPAIVTLQAANDVSLLSSFREDWNPDLTWANQRFNISSRGAHYSSIGYIAHRAFDANRHLESPRTVGKWPATPIVQEMQKNLREFLATCRERDIKVVVLPVDPFYYQTKNQDKNPSLPSWQVYETYIVNWTDCIDEFNAALRQELALHKDAWFFDTRPIFDATDRREMYVDYIHYSDKGNAIVADELLRFLESKGCLSK
jgi:lysophospholipase L1-like esterase